MLFQAIAALFAVIGVYTVCWALLNRIFRKGGKLCARILVRVTESDPATLFREISLLQEHFPRGSDLQTWLICPEGTPWTELCTALARRDEGLRTLSGEEAHSAAEAFLRGQ